MRFKTIKVYLNKILILLLVGVFAGLNGQTTLKDKMIEVREINLKEEVSIQQVSELLDDKAEIHRINLVNWQKFPYHPDVRFRIAHSNNQIWLKFYVHEENILAHRIQTNSSTHMDSCVEFFLDPKQDGNYYNFEFNCIGTIHLAHGPGRKERQFIEPSLIEEKILVNSTLGKIPFNEKKGGHSWEMTIIIPSEILVYEKNLQLSGLEAKANFYKCGDNTSKPHYLSWNPVGTESPDFHRPEFFGNLIFE